MCAFHNDVNVHGHQSAFLPALYVIVVYSNLLVLMIVIDSELSFNCNTVLCYVLYIFVCQSLLIPLR